MGAKLTLSMPRASLGKGTEALEGAVGMPSGCTFV